ncbi:Lrp/AsnC family transcriptional regulator [Neisseria shayeganii]|uniref:Lrp/AsnC family transcriptional regulator n=1 Tax=Neisseria shayeganii TaxID=607712 RepID=A0A7D7N8W6_9NEIS|nr:Lrp/AsnC family transcriptional regulator [Neisseria shayeganii]QMT41481.1 Lrp/AsnC family transcriptional regulator [Neisseria shayeganii]
MKKFNDRTSQAILRELRRNARISWQALGQTVHLSGQAVAERVRQMQDAGIINGFTLKETRMRHFIGVRMQHTHFDEFENWLLSWENIESVDKTSGDTCYQIVYATDDLNELEHFLNHLLQHGAYRLHSSIRRVK